MAPDSQSTAWSHPLAGADEEARLLAGCPASDNPHLLAIVIGAMETGMRLGEIMG